MPAQKKNKSEAKGKANATTSSTSSSTVKTNTRAPTNEATVKSVLQNPALSVVMAGYLDRKELLTLPRLAKWVNTDDHDQAWRGLFERHWIRKWFCEATAAVAAGGTTWKQQYKRRHEMTTRGGGVVDELDGKLSFTRGGGASVESWKDGSWSLFTDDDMRDMTKAESELILVNKGKLHYQDFQVGPSGGEVPPGSDVVKRSADFFISPKGKKRLASVLPSPLHAFWSLEPYYHVYISSFLPYNFRTYFLGYFTVREALHIMLHRYTGKNSAKAAHKVGNYVIYEGALGMGGFGLGGWGS